MPHIRDKVNDLSAISKEAENVSLYKIDPFLANNKVHREPLL